MITIDKITGRENSRVRVTFTMPASPSWGCLYLVGKFNEWNESVYCMQCADGDTWSMTLELEPGREYQYRFRTLDGRWLNDPTSLLVPIPLGSDNSFVDTLAVPASFV